jgi:hypothetical protein
VTVDDVEPQLTSMVVTITATRREDVFIRSTMVWKTLLVGCLMLVCKTHSAAQYAEPVNHGGLYFGPRLGLPFILGVRARYVAANDDEPVFYVDADAATSILINTLSIGGGVYPLGKTLYFGGKYHQLSTPLLDDPQAATGLYSLELGAAIALGEKRSWILMIDGGPIVNPIAEQLQQSGDVRVWKVLPNVTLSLVGRLF